jgi:NAD(P)-dependent dehydrogenase (short-subunit alcohol dehydrogenase family)
VGVNGHVPAPPNDFREAAVSDYLHGLREMVGAQRDVMLAFLGAESAPWTPSPARALPTTASVNGGANGNGAAHPPAGANGNGHGAGHDSTEEAAPAPALDAEGLLAIVVTIVSDRTGYPTEMLDPDLDIEAELSIDSIKRIEILGELADRVGLPGMDDTGVDDSVIEELALIKTLRGIVDWIVEAEQAEGGTAPAAPATAAPADEDTGVDVPAELGLSVPVLEEADSDVGFRRLPDHGVVLLGSEDGVAGRLLTLLDGVGVTAAVHSQPSARPAELGPISLLVDCRALASDGGEDPAPAGDPSALTRRITSHFASLKDHLEAGVDEVVVLVGGGGRLGLGATHEPPAVAMSEAAALRAMAKTAVRETAASVRIVDVDAALDPDALAGLVLAELRRVEANVEVGLSTAGRVVVGYEPAPTQIGSVGPPVALGPDAALLITGGARGIGARVARAAAERFGCPIEVVGRTPMPHEPEPDDVAAATDAAAIRRLLIEEGKLTSPRAIEDETQRLLAAREVRTALADLARVAPSVRYNQLDVRDADGLRSLVADVRARHGRIGAVIHAAGVREDKLLRDKTPESFERVVATKVEPALVLDAALHDHELLVSFGSVSGVFGNAGQVDYAAANAVLDATTLARAARGAAALSLDWGPWAGGGMVTPELEREYERRGVGLVQPDEGVALVLDALAGSIGSSQLVVVRAPLDRLQGDREVELYEADEPLLDGVRG